MKITPMKGTCSRLDSFPGLGRILGMSSETRDLIEICEQLPQSKRIEVADFARSLLAQNGESAPRREAAEKWLSSARGAAKPGLTTDQLMDLTRGEA